jgi:DNA modification methylase
MNVLDQKSGKNWVMYRGDCCEVIQGLPDRSIDFSIFSPPFAQLYVYSDNERDMGNSKTYDQFFTHFEFLAKELFRVIKKGRLVSIHCIDIPAMIERDGYLGLKDFPGHIIQLFEKVGFIYHSRHVIWNDPLIEATRTKSVGLLHNALCKDSNRSRAGLPDYLVTFRHPEENETPISHENGLTKYYGTDVINETGVKFSHMVWRKYASPVWMDVKINLTLNAKAGRSDKDERHICPLSLQTIARAVELWSLPGEVVFTPYMGIGSEVFQSVLMGRKGIGIELKESYFNTSVKNLTLAEDHWEQEIIIEDNDLDVELNSIDSKLRDKQQNTNCEDLTDLF